MKFTEFLESEKVKPEGAALFLASKTNNIFEINHLVDKAFVPAILKRLEMAAIKNDSVKVGELKALAIMSVPSDYSDDVTSHVNKIIEEKTPASVMKNARKILQPM